MTSQTDARALLQINNLQVSFRTGKHDSLPVLKGISFAIPYNTTVALVGESGSGKSVSSLAIMGLLPADSAMPPATCTPWSRKNFFTRAACSSASSRRSRSWNVLYEMD